MRKFNAVLPSWKAAHSYIGERDKGICTYCGKSGDSIDHVFPVCAGGPTVKGNLVQSCRSCNRAKRDKIDEKLMQIAFRHLLACGESLDWLNEVSFPERYKP